MINFFATHFWFYIFMIAILGVVVGSFLNVLIYRLPIILERNWRQECLDSLTDTGDFSVQVNHYNLAFPPSHCPHCKTPIKIWHNIPIISYLILQGRCATCATKIPFRYPLVELLSCILSIFIALEFGLSMNMIAGLLFTWILIAITFIDLEHQIIPDVLTYLLLWFGLLFNCFNLFANSRDAILGTILGYVFFFVIGKIFYWVTKKEGIGQGDYKLLAAVGAWIGWDLLPLTIVSSGILGIIVGGGFLLLKRKSKNTPIPFGPFIAIAAWIALIWGFDITQSYLHLFGIYWSDV